MSSSSVRCEPLNPVTTIATVETVAPCLLSVSILLRHGARGPGASEMTPFPETCDVSTEWRPSDFEQLSPYGHSMIKTLGGWFATTYSSQFSNPNVTFRCSKSGRAKESGNDFMAGFNKALSKESARVSEKPTPFYDTDKRPIDEDYFFRPWKVHKEIVEAIKSSAQLDKKFVDIAENNKELLHDLFVLAGAKDELIRNTYKSFWSTTHLSALLDCEKYWHNAHERTALLNRIPPIMRGRVEELACHVWSRRFTDLGVDPVLGAPLSLEILQQSFNRNCRLNIYSGHDYTILCILGSLNITRKISNASHFGSYLIFELWDRAGGDREDASPSQDCDTNTVSVTQSVDCYTGTVDPVQESCSVVGVGDTIAFDNTLRQARSGVALYGCNRHGDGDGDGYGYGESDNTLCSCDGTPPNEVTDVTATATATDVTLNEKIQKSDGLQSLLGLSENKNKMNNVFLQTVGDEVEDQRFLRISANFSPFEARDDTSKERLNHEVNEKNIVLLAELSIREIKEKHDFLFQSLISRGYFVPLISTTAVSQR